MTGQAHRARAGIHERFVDDQEPVMRALPRGNGEQIVERMNAAIRIVRIDDDGEIGGAEFIERRRQSTHRVRREKRRARARHKSVPTIDGAARTRQPASSVMRLCVPEAGTTLDSDGAP